MVGLGQVMVMVGLGQVMVMVGLGQVKVRLGQGRRVVSTTGHYYYRPLLQEIRKSTTSST